MSDWRPQLYRSQAKAVGVTEDVVRAANKTATAIRRANNRVPVVLTLNHLSQLSGVPYGFLRKVVSRELLDPYRAFQLLKRPLPDEPVRFRRITVPHPPLMNAQKWIASKILVHGRVHDASVAFAPKSTLLGATQPHCQAQWLIKIDVKSFFESVSERLVYRAFRDLGYEPLVAFEMTRICTRVGSIEYRRKIKSWSVDKNLWPTIKAYGFPLMGHLPQGAPTSPMLANLSVVPLDEAIQKIADANGLTFTRYADDLALSTTSSNFSRDDAQAIIFEVYQKLQWFGLKPNLLKTVVSPPGTRKILLGLYVDRDVPRLSRNYKSNLRKHLYYLNKFGPSEHASRCKSASVYGLKAHIEGLISHAAQIEPDYAALCYERLSTVDWP